MNLDIIQFETLRARYFKIRNSFTYTEQQHPITGPSIIAAMNNVARAIETVTHESILTNQ